MGQDEIYERWFRAPLEAHGAVIVWHAGRWSILVSRPEWLTDMFRNDNLYVKAGSQVKNPHSVIATLVGDNIINSHQNWKLYTSIMKPGLQRKVFDTTSLLRQSNKLVDVLISKGKGSIQVNDDVQKWAVDVMGENFLGLDLEVLKYWCIDLVHDVSLPPGLGHSLIIPESRQPKRGPSRITTINHQSHPIQSNILHLSRSRSLQLALHLPKARV